MKKKTILAVPVGCFWGVVAVCVVGIIVGCLIGYWFESPALRGEYGFGLFFGHFIDIMFRQTDAKGNWLTSPLFAYLLSVVTFGLVGLFLGALIPNKRRPVKLASDEAETA